VLDIADNLFKREKLKLSKEDEVEFLKRDPALFAEKYLGVKLQLWQKMYLRYLEKIK